ncbi:hypothetical protein ZHAS_00011816 [Anopheles sinensis]|uniref:Uncharacterized protein n=1 Tax=Anopheles sinensis TaxID=74873 RepID=A0A084W194_ANOSI|nr:hypothetical protein ZHAS_00011816 [Anopheles sinensis]
MFFPAWGGGHLFHRLQIVSAKRFAYHVAEVEQEAQAGHCNQCGLTVLTVWTTSSNDGTNGYKPT